MVRLLLLVLGVLIGMPLGAQDLGRSDRLWREYLSQTVRRGLPLLAGDPGSGVVPFWPALTRARFEAESLEPGADVVLLTAWIDRAEGTAPPVTELRTQWPRPALVKFSPRQWGDALFASWDTNASPREWTDAWLAWSDKTYSPAALTRGLETLEKTDPSAVVPLLTQALEFYPEDRRFLPLVARHPEAAVSAEGLISRDKVNTGGFSPATLRDIQNRQPASRELLLRAGYTAADLAGPLDRDYGVWLATGAEKIPQAGGWWWDSDNDGTAETDLVYDAQGLGSWSRKTGDGLWTLSMRSGQPDTLMETRAGASWTLRWESYPWASSLEYRWGNRTMVYRFRPLAQSIPLWPAERLKVPTDRFPASLAALWLPLDPRALTASAATVETWEGRVKTDTVFLFRGQVWLEVEDTDKDGRDDTWSYFKSGDLASVYHDAEGRGQVGLRELYRKGQLSQVQSRSKGLKNEFVLFPLEGVQLWDPHGDGRPLQRLFVWEGQETLGALVFAKDELPWETMPAWEPRP